MSAAGGSTGRRTALGEGKLVLVHGVRSRSQLLGSSLKAQPAAFRGEEGATWLEGRRGMSESPEEGVVWGEVDR